MLRLTLRADLSPEASQIVSLRQIRSLPLEEVAIKVCNSISQDLSIFSVCVLGNTVNHAIAGVPAENRGPLIESLAKRHFDSLSLKQGWRYVIAITGNVKTVYFSEPPKTPIVKAPEIPDQQEETKPEPGTLIFGPAIQNAILADDYENGLFNKLPMFGYRQITLQKGSPDVIFEAVQPIRSGGKAIGVLRLGFDPDRCLSNDLLDDKKKTK